MAVLKSLIIIQASEDIPQSEVDNIKSQVELYGIVVSVYKVITLEELKLALKSGRYDYIYLATHGCEDSWGSVSQELQITWIKFAAEVCVSGVSKPGAIFLHSCCRGGLQKVAYDMFACCEQIQLICGPRYKIKSRDLLMAFNLFLYYIEVKGIDPIVAADKVLISIDIRLHCTDRVECCHTRDFKDHCTLYNNIIQEAFDFKSIEELVETSKIV